MKVDPLERLARRQTVRRALAFVGISAAIVLSVVARAQTTPPPVSALSSPELAKPVGGTDASAGPSSAPPTSAANPPAPAGGSAKPKKHHRPRPAHTTPGTVAAPTSRRVGSATTPPPTTVTPGHTSAPAPHTTLPPVTHTTAPATTRVLTGSAYDVGYGIVQVRVTVRGSTILDVSAVSMPQGGHSGDITAMAEPQLRREAISAQSAQINAVSGATYTSSGYAKSLQSALDKAAA